MVKFQLHFLHSKQKGPNWAVLKSSNKTKIHPKQFNEFSEPPAHFFFSPHTLETTTRSEKHEGAILKLVGAGTAGGSGHKHRGWGDTCSLRLVLWARELLKNRNERTRSSPSRGWEYGAGVLGTFLSRPPQKGCLDQSKAASASWVKG